MGKLFENRKPTKHACAILILAICIFSLVLSFLVLQGVLRGGTVKIDVLLVSLVFLSPSVYGVHQYAKSRDFDEAFCWF